MFLDSSPSTITVNHMYLYGLVITVHTPQSPSVTCTWTHHHPINIPLSPSVTCTRHYHHSHTPSPYVTCT